ncbi:MAG TPA: PQQ-binding-like beta-propeller repeat protein [Pirellulales bacterium]|nr:PQQ-binding-like beta-propeller repeat protein [Pirellulales bacterium]
MNHFAFRLLFSALVLCGLLLGRIAQAQTDAKDWPMYNHDVLGTRFNAAETAINRETAHQLIEKWRFPPQGAEQEIGVIHATPTVVGGYVYFGTTTRNPTFYKLAPDGTVRWSYRNPAYGQTESRARAGADKVDGPIVRLQTSDEGGIFSSALVTQDMVFFGDMGGWFYGLDRATGKERWKLNARGDGFPGAHQLNVSMASPILADGKLIVAGGTLEQLIAALPGYKCCTSRGFVAALEPKTGEVLWKYDVGPVPQPLDPPITIKDGFGEHVFHSGPSTSSVWCTPSFDADSGTVYFGTDVNTAPRRPTDDDPRMHTRESCAIIAVSVADGSEKWVTQLNPGDVWTNAMRSYDPKEGRYKDQSIGDTPKIYTIAIDGKPTKVVGAGCKNGGFYVLRADNGEIIDHTPLYTGPPAYPLVPEPDRKMLALPSAIGGLQTGCATDGRTIYTNGIDALWLAAVASRNLADVPGYIIKHGPVTGGRVVALALDTRSERWRHERPRVAALGGPPPKPAFSDVGDPVASGIAVANGVVYFTAVASGKLVALDAASGELLKEIDLGPVWSGPSVSRGRVYVGTGNTQFTPSDYEAFFPKKYTGVMYSFGLPGEDEVSRLDAKE